MVFLVSRVLASGTRLYFAGILLVIAYQFMTDTTADANQIVLLYIAALVVISIATTIYTAIGGLKAVVWTDVLQAVVLGVSMLSALWVLFSHIPGGWNSISAAMNGGDDWKFFSWGTKEGLDFLQQCAHVLGQEYTVWAAFLGVTFITMATHGTDQDMVQRMLAAKSSKAGTRAVIVSGLLDFPIVIVFLFTGILLYVFYQYNPASLPADTPQLHVFPYFIIHELPNGIRGLLIAGLLATAMGSLSTALNSLATTATKDWYQGVFKPEATERQLLRCVRWGTAGFSLLLILGILGWAGIARLVRGQILSLREQEFMTATEACGISVSRRIFRHLIPNVIPQLIVNCTMSLGSTIITEATLSFLGLGVKFPFASWGNIMNDVSNSYVLTSYWFIWIPAGICLMLTVLGFNFVGDGLRDAFDPKMKR